MHRALLAGLAGAFVASVVMLASGFSAQAAVCTSTQLGNGDYNMMDGQGVPQCVTADTAPDGSIRQNSDSVVPGTAQNRGGAITAGGTAQQLMAANPARRGWAVENQSTGDLYVNCIGTATLDQNSLKIAAGAYFETPSHFVGQGACSIIGATTGQNFYGREF